MKLDIKYRKAPVEEATITMTAEQFNSLRTLFQIGYGTAAFPLINSKAAQEVNEFFLTHAPLSE